jgi:hypothetical protein
MTDTFRISTRVNRNEDGDVLDFKVLCNPFSEEEQSVDCMESGRDFPLEKPPHRTHEPSDVPSDTHC